MRTILVIVYEDTTDTAQYRFVQGEKYGEAVGDMTTAEKNQAKNLIKKLSGIIKTKAPTPKAGK